MRTVKTKCNLFQKSPLSTSRLILSENSFGEVSSSILYVSPPSKLKTTALFFLLLCSTEEFLMSASFTTASEPPDLCQTFLSVTAACAPEIRLIAAFVIPI